MLALKALEKKKSIAARQYIFANLVQAMNWNQYEEDCRSSCRLRFMAFYLGKKREKG